MTKRCLGAIALVCALAGAACAQNTTTFGAITSGQSSCQSSNCVYYQLPPNTPWVVATLSGTWSGTVNIVLISAPNANYSNLNSVPWTTVATESGNGTWSVSASGATYVLVESPNWSSGTAQVEMTASQTGAPMTNPIFPGSATANGVVAPSGGSATNCWTTSGSSTPCAGGGSWASITGGTQTGSGSSQVNTFPGSIAAGASLSQQLASFLATGANSSADLTALQNAISASPASQPAVNPFYLFPQTAPYWTTDGSQVATITTPIGFIGQGSFNQLNVPLGSDGFVIKPSTYKWPTQPTGLGADGYYYQNVPIRDTTFIEASAPGTWYDSGHPSYHNIRYMLRLDASNQSMNLNIENDRFFGTNSGYDLFLNNATSGGLAPNQSAQNSNGGVYLSSILNSFLYGGIYLNKGGDTNLFFHNRMNPPYNGIYLDQIGGADDNVIEYNNITSGGCPIYLAGGYSDNILYNEVGVSPYYWQIINSGFCALGDIVVSDGTDNVGGTNVTGNLVGVDEKVVSGVTINVPGVYVGSTGIKTSVTGNAFETNNAQPFVYNAGALTYVTPNNWRVNSTGTPTAGFIAGPGSTAWNTNKSLEGAAAVGVLDNRLHCSDDLTCTYWVEVNSGAGSLPSVANVSGVGRPEDPNGSDTVSCFEASLNGGTTIGDESYIYQNISGLPNPHPTVGSAWLASNVEVTGVTVTGSGSGATTTYALAQIAACPGGSTTAGAAVGQPYTIANVNPSACNVTAGTVTSIGTNTVTVATPNTACSGYVSGGNVVFKVGLVTNANSAEQDVGWESPSYPDLGWTRAFAAIPASYAGTTDTLQLALVGTGVNYTYSDSVNLLFAGADNARGLFGHLTTYYSTQQQLKYGVAGNAIHGRIPAEQGIQFVNTSGPEACGASTLNLTWVNPSVRPSQMLLCSLESNGSYNWHTIMTPEPQSENYLLQSNSLTTSPWIASHVSGGSNPVVTYRGAVTDPFGNTGDVWEITFAVTTSNTDYSELLQTISGLTNPNTPTGTVWVKSVSGTPTMFTGLVGVQPQTRFVPSTTAWMPVTNRQTVNATSEQWIIFLAGGYGSTTADIYVAMPQVSFKGGSYAVTTSSPIDNTANAITGCSAGQYSTGQISTAGAPGCAAGSTLQSGGVATSSSGKWIPVAEVASSQYSGVAPTGLTTIYTPSAANEFMLCGNERIVTSPSAQTQAEVYRSYTSDGHSDTGPINFGANGASTVALGTTLTQWAKASGCEVFWSDASAIQAELYLSGVSGTAFTLTQVSVSGSTTTYTGTFTGGGSNAFAGQTFVVTGFTNSGNNVTCNATASTATTITCTTTTQVNETNSATATEQPRYRWGVNLYQMQ